MKSRSTWRRASGLLLPLVALGSLVVGFDSMRRMVERYPGVAWSPMWDG